MITIKDIEHLANLSRIELSAEEKNAFVKEFDSILGYIDQLKKVKVDMDEAGRVGALRNVMRDDIIHERNTDEREALLREAPLREKDFVAVKKIIAQD